MSYAAGTIRPSHVSQATLDQAVRDFYDAWKARFLRQTCGSGRWVVLTHVDGANLTVSEGHGYGMVLMALVAGHEPDAQQIFDGMVDYFRAHPTEFHDHLMSWYQNNACDTPSGSLDSASDGDPAPAGGLCSGRPCWRAKSLGFRCQTRDLVRIPAESITDSDASRSPVPSMAITRSEATRGSGLFL